MKHTIVKVSYTELVFDSAEKALRFYAMLTEATPVTNPPYFYGSEANQFKVPDSLKHIERVRASDVDIELKQVDDSKLALHWTQDEFKEKCRVQPTEIDGDARLLEESALKLSSPDFGSGTMGDIL